MIATRHYRKTTFILSSLLLLAFHFWSSEVTANDHKRRESHYKIEENREEHHGYNDPQGRQIRKKDEGNEFTGQTAAWLFVRANLSVSLSIIMKGVSRFFGLKPETITLIKRFNQLQKKHLMRFHYVLNPSALFMGIFHFLLSSCRKSSLPEWGLVFVIIMVLLGLTLRFKLGPKWIRRFIYRLHTSAATLSALILVLVVGHMIVD
jgi:hypothetical protein